MELVPLRPDKAPSPMFTGPSYRSTALIPELGIKRKLKSEPDCHTLGLLRVEGYMLGIITLVAFVVRRPCNYQGDFAHCPSDDAVVNVAIHDRASNVRRADPVQRPLIGMPFSKSSECNAKVWIAFLFRLRFLQLIAGACRQSKQKQGDEGWSSSGHARNTAPSPVGNPFQLYDSTVAGQFEFFDLPAPQLRRSALIASELFLRS